MSRLSLAILENERAGADHRWVEACRARADRVSFKCLDITRSDWLDQVRSGHYDGLLARPPAYSAAFRELYQERVRILHTALGIPVYPTLDEISIYENKRYLAYWLEAQRLPHPRTWVFYHRREAEAFLRQSAYPLVGKTNIGASGRGVHILRDESEAWRYVSETFTGKGATRSVGPRWKKKGFIGRVFRKMLDPRAFRAQLAQYRHQRNDVQKDFVILQAFVPHAFEWRCVRIGDSFFAHKKIAKDGKASGTLVKGYENPPLDLLDFVLDLTEARGFRSLAVDVFVTAEGQYLINEMQCIFGQSDPYQMLVNGQPGRYLHRNGHWVFEAGDFNAHESYELRLDDFLTQLSWKTVSA